MNVYEEDIVGRINKIAGKSVYFDVVEIMNSPESICNEIITLLLSYACQSQNIKPITIAKNALIKFPYNWITEKIMKLCYQTMNIDDEWEYRRFLELVQIISNDLLKWAISLSKDTSSQEILIIANEFSELLEMSTSKTEVSRGRFS